MSSPAWIRSCSGSPRIGRCAQFLAKDTNAFLVLAQGCVTLPAESAERHHLTMSAFVQLIQRQPTRALPSASSRFPWAASERTSLCRPAATSRRNSLGFEKLPLVEG